MRDFKIKYELERVNVFFTLALGGAFLLIDFAVWCAVGSPVYVLRFISGRVSVLPLWLFGLLDITAFTFLGCSLGGALTAKGSCGVDRYRGAFYFIIGVTLFYLHHIFFFVYCAFLVSFFMSAFIFFLLVVAVINFFRVSRVASLSAVLGGLWSLYILIFSMLVFFNA